mmetsp:Transcript_11997/g.29044  ORF Transcript_11997/g.29044 Transcript_11997/m.29044 type:complete len:200 (-) Transcript_11997:916-1515(-)
MKTRCFVLLDAPQLQHAALLPRRPPPQRSRQRPVPQPASTPRSTALSRPTSSWPSCGAARRCGGEYFRPPRYSTFGSPHLLRRSCLVSEWSRRRGPFLHRPCARIRPAWFGSTARSRLLRRWMSAVGAALSRPVRDGPCTFGSPSRSRSPGGASRQVHPLLPKNSRAHLLCAARVQRLRPQTSRRGTSADADQHYRRWR